MIEYTYSDSTKSKPLETRMLSATVPDPQTLDYVIEDSINKKGQESFERIKDLMYIPNVDKDTGYFLYRR